MGKRQVVVVCVCVSEHTGVAMRGKVDGDLPADAAGRAHDESDGFAGGSHGVPDVQSSAASIGLKKGSSNSLTEVRVHMFFSKRKKTN